ncbi:MAG: HEAT repeat domain-containing protein, partial [Gemmataceae bacterium]|nr:HEAT repeat domain-containing protein [Gemmataceae bacterium]
MRRFAALGGLIGSILLLALPGTGETTATLDEQVLQAAKIPTTDAGLREFLRLRSQRADDKRELARLVEQLGSGTFKERDAADKQLLMRGHLALPYLKGVVAKAPLEVTRRAENLIKAIEAMGPELPVAAARLLAHRQAPGAIETLLAYLPSAPDEWVEEEVLACLSQLAVRAGKVDARLLAALHDPFPPVRGAAVYVLGRRADADQRHTVRKFLADPDPKVRERAALALAGKRLPQIIRDTAAQDDEMIKQQQLRREQPALLEFLQRRTLSDDDQNRLRRLIRELGHAKFRVRDEASRQLVKEGTPALAFLKEAETSGDAEVARRVRLCIDEIRKGPGPALPIAVVHHLARPSLKDPPPANAIRVLLGYVPFADDETVEEEVINALTILSAREPGLDPALPAALTDPLPARRGTAALVLGRVGTKEHIRVVHKLLDDPLRWVRFR